MNSMCLLVHSSFDDCPGVLIRRNTWTLSGMSISVSLHGGSGCGFVCSVFSSILLLILVIHVMNLIFGLCHAPSQLDPGDPSHMHIHLMMDHDSTQLNALPHVGNMEHSLT